MLVSSVADLFGMELVARKPDPADPKEVIALNGTLAGIAHNMHKYAGITIIVCVILHVVGALKHHVIDKSVTLKLTLGGEV